MVVVIVLLLVLAIGLTIGFYFYKQRVMYRSALDLMSITTNLYLDGSMDTEEYAKYKENVYGNFSRIQKYWLRKLKGD